MSLNTDIQISTKDLFCFIFTTTDLSYFLLNKVMNICSQIVSKGIKYFLLRALFVFTIVLMFKSITISVCILIYTLSGIHFFQFLAYNVFGISILRIFLPEHLFSLPLLIS